MVRLWVAVTFLYGGAAMAQPRLAVHPLGFGNFPPEQQEILKSQFEVLVARVAGVKLAGSSRIDDTLTKAAATNCEVRDSCLRFLAESTDSLYGMYVRVDNGPTGVIASGRVVRSDGETVRKVRVDAESARDALVLALRELKLDALESTMPSNPLPVSESLSPPPMPPAALELAREHEAPTRWKKVAGWSLIGVGAATVASGAVFAGLAASDAAANPPDSTGVISAEHVAGAANAVERSRISAVLIPTGAALAVIGAILVVWPSASDTRYSLGVMPTHEGVMASLSGTLP